MPKTHQMRKKLQKTDEPVAGCSKSIDAPVPSKRTIRDVATKRKYAESDDEEKTTRRASKRRVSKSKVPTVRHVLPPVSVDRCGTCRQLLTEACNNLYEGHPVDAEEEMVALTDERLCVFGEEAEMLTEERPSHKITDFSVYDREGHLCPFDMGLIEYDVPLLFSGYLKPIFDDDPDIEGGVPAKDLGPINEWWVAGFDGGEKVLIGFTTAYADYYLMQPSTAYQPFMAQVHLKTHMSKMVIEFLIENCDNNITYEDLLEHVEMSQPPPGVPKLNEEGLLRNAQFICDQVTNISEISEDGDEPPNLLLLPCMETLISLGAVSVGETKKVRQKQHRQRRVVTKKAPAWTKATTTPLVKAVFEKVFEGQLDQADNNEVNALPSVSCKKSNCGKCATCTIKQPCSKERCRKITHKDENKIPDKKSQVKVPEANKKKLTERATQTKSDKHQLKRPFLCGPKVSDLGNFAIHNGYGSLELGVDKAFIVKAGSFVLLTPMKKHSLCHIARLCYILKDHHGKAYGHFQFFVRAEDTMLGDSATSSELFQLEECMYVPMQNVECPVDVKYKPVPGNWSELGGLADHGVDLTSNIDTKTFWYTKSYTKKNARFTDLPEDPANEEAMSQFKYCGVCERRKISDSGKFTLLDKLTNEETNEKKKKNKVLYSGVKWHGQILRPGSCVYVKPDAIQMPNQFKKTTKIKSNKGQVDEDIYPENYRKSEVVLGSNTNTPDPFSVVRIISIFTSKTAEKKEINKGNVRLLVAKFYRPENTNCKAPLDNIHELDLNLLYWSTDECEVQLPKVQGKCWVRNAASLNTSPLQWSSEGPHRFYFNKMYNAKSNTFLDDLPVEALHFGQSLKEQDKGKRKSSSVKQETDEPESWPTISKPLRCLDVFAGCGGLSEGLHQAGIASTEWAIEKIPSAAKAFQLNNPKSTVFTEDCNILLKMIMDQETQYYETHKLPVKGDVEMIVGGPPCQGFSGMNRFNAREYSQFKNSLVVSFLSYCDYYRPKFFLLENVRNLVAFKNGMVLKLAMRCLVAMGYQCTFGVLQAGNYGIPQSRRRAIILAAAPGEKLPVFPEPTHSFNPKNCQLNVSANNKLHKTGCEWTVNAPLRTVTVRDAMSDLPKICNGEMREEMKYNGEPRSYFQKLIRKDQSILRDHICKDMAPLVEARMSLIPLHPGADWRDLPNTVVKRRDGISTKKLVYMHPSKRQGKSSSGALRGVCSCAAGEPCDPMCRQDNTLIPWCLPHTADKNNHWSGLYGRLQWDGFFSTTVTNPEPMAKQGRVLHPEQTRVVSVRECARSQGFPDSFCFYGTIVEKHRQVGNAVPPPLGCAIGMEIRRSVSLKENCESK